MSDKTGIQWTDATWNPIVGCSVVSPGCTNCYAMKTAARFNALPSSIYYGLTQPSKAGPVWTGDLAFNEKALTQPLRWRRPRRIFVNSMGDVFHENATDDQIDAVFAVMEACSRHTFQVLTKRAARMREYCSGRCGGPLPNVWLGVSAEDQARYDERAPELANTPAAVRFISYEPALGPLDLSTVYPMPDWVIVGGESGPKARPFDVQWAHAVVLQCHLAGVACFVKQLGSKPYDSDEPPFLDPAMRDRKGGDWNEWPADLRVREWPSQETTAPSPQAQDAGTDPESSPSKGLQG